MVHTITCSVWGNQIFTILSTLVTPKQSEIVRNKNILTISLCIYKQEQQNICFSYFSNKGITQSLLNANEVKKRSTMKSPSHSFSLNKNNNNEIQEKNPSTLFKIEESLYKAQDEFYCLSFCYRNWSETRVEVSLENIFC